VDVGSIPTASTIKEGKNMKNTLNLKLNKTQAIIKLQVAKENLEGVDEALSNYNRPRIAKALSIVDEVLSFLTKEKEEGFKNG